MITRMFTEEYFDNTLQVKLAVNPLLREALKSLDYEKTVQAIKILKRYNININHVIMHVYEPNTTMSFEIYDYLVDNGMDAEKYKPNFFDTIIDQFFLYSVQIPQYGDNS